MMLHRTIRRAALCIGIILASSMGSAALAGGLAPPVGPVAPTMKTLTEVEPRTVVNATNTPGDVISVYKITAPGSYYLAGNVTAPAGKHAIEISVDASASVSLDLNGFTVRAGAPGTLNGILVSNTGSVVIRNGHIVGFGSFGIIALAPEIVIEGVSARNCGLNGIRGLGNGIIRECYVENAGSSGMYFSSGKFSVERCVAFVCGTAGFECVTACVLNDCIAIDNTTGGFLMGSGSVARGCLAYSNGGYGFVLGDGSSIFTSASVFNDVGVSTSVNARLEQVSCYDNNQYGIYLGTGSLAKGVVTSANGDDGFITGGLCTFEGCLADNNAGYGFNAAGDECTFTSCVSSTNGGGFRTGAMARMTDCESTENPTHGFEAGADLIASGCRATGNASDGFRAGVRASISDCSASANTGDGFEAGASGRFESCASANNSGRGISAGDASQVVQCRISDNSGDGILVGNGSHVEGNAVRNNALAGISVNFSTRVSGNTLNGNGSAPGNQGGIYVIGRQNEIVDNTLSFDDMGILVTGTRNFIGRNTAGESTVGDYSIVAGNSYGPIVNIAGAGDISGTANANHPQANFRR